MLEEYGIYGLSWQNTTVSGSWSLSRRGDDFNRYFAMITAAVASVTGLITGFKTLVKTCNDFEERFNNIKCLFSPHLSALILVKIVDLG